MNKNLFCPNLNLPENKALVEKLGLFGFYREYIKNDFNIPNEIYEDLADTSKTVEDLIYINKELFSKSQQDEVVDSILYQVQQYRLDGESNVNTIKNNVLNDFKETVEYFKEDTSEEAADLVRSLNNVIDNYDQFFRLVDKKLASQDITVDTNDISDFNNEESSYDSAENLNQKLNYSDESAFKQSSKDTASANLKIALSLIPKYVYENGDIMLDSEGNFETELSFIGSPTFESIDVIWNDLLYTLIDVPIGSKLDYLDNSNNPRHRMIAYHIKNNPDTSLINQFESVFSKQQAKFVTVVYSRPDKTGVKSIKVLDTNRLNADNLLVDVWYEGFLNSPYIANINGNKAVNSEKGKELLSEYDNVLKTLKTDLNQGLKDTKLLLNKIGIDISMKALESEGIYINKELNNPVSIINNNLKYIFNKLAGDVEVSELTEDALELNNPFVDESSTLNLLAKLENKANPNTFEASFVGGDGKARYSFVNNTYASHKVRQLKTDLGYLNKLKTTAYASGSFYLNKLISDPNFREIFDLFYVDSLGNDANNQENKTFSRMNTKEKELTKISLFQNAGRGTTNRDSNIGQFIGLVPSDKSTTPIFKTLKVNVKSSSSVNEDGNYTFNSETIEVIYDQFISEYNRVKQTLFEISNKNVRMINQYHTGDKIGTKFIVFPFMNSLMFDNGNLIELDDIRIRDIVKPRLQKFLSDLTKDQIKYWKEIGIYPTTDNHNNFFDKSYAKKNGIRLINPTNEDLSRSANSFAANYAVNQFVFMMNQTQLISGDPALHGKSIARDGDPDSGSAYSKTWINFYKRMAKDIAPGTDGNFGENANFNTIFLKDLGYTSEQFMNYMDKLGPIIADSYGYKKDKNGEYTDEGIINPADAQEYTTLDEHLNVMRAYGRISSEQEEAVARLKEGGSDINDIKLILQPMKPVYVNSQIEGGINNIYYIKSSSFPLIPALTKGLEIDKLRVLMENNKDENGNSNPIQRAAYESAVKLGLQGDMTNVSNDGGTVWNELSINPNQIINLTRDGFRLQQEMPYHGDNPNTNEGSQGRKLVLNNLPNTEIITFNGKQYAGREVKDIFERLHIEKMDRSLNKLVTDLGFSNETGKLEDISKIQKIIQEEAESRNYPINDLYSIQLIKGSNGKDTFKVPLSFTNNATRFESILNSVFTNRVIKSELPGFMGIQGASSGFSRVMTDEDFNETIFSSGITWLDPNDTKLNYIREDDNGDILSADILVPNYFRNADGDRINLSEYINEDGTLDTSKIPEELLTVIGLRIPTQGYNSMMKFRVKGFLPNIVGDLVIVPAEVTIQMGSDFDVDKLFIYRYHYKMNSNGNLSKITANLPDNATDIDYSSLSEKQIDNLIIQTFEDRLSYKNLMDQILTPNGFGKLPDVANEVSKLDKTASSVHSWSTREQNSISDVNIQGKSGTAIFSLFSTFFKASQDAGLTIAEPFIVKNSKGEVISLNSLSSINNVEGDKRSDVIMYLQSAAVDNAKEQILGKLNINDYTMGVAGTMAMLGYPEDYIGYFLSQPILKEFSSRVSSANDIVSGTIDPSAPLRVIRELKEELLGENNNNISLNNAINNIPIGAAELKTYLENRATPNLPTNLTSEELTALSKVDDLFGANVINTFERLLNLAENVQTLQSATNVDTKGLGATYGAVQAKNLQLTRVLNGIKKVGYPILGASNLFTDNTVGKANEVLIKANNLLGQIYTYNSASYQKILEEILKESSLSPTETNLKDIYNNLKSFILSNPELLNLDEVNTVRDSLLYGKDNIAKRWLDYTKSPEGKRNPLTKRITPKFSKNNEDYNGVKAVNTPASNNSHDIDNMLGYFYDMLNSSNANEKQLAEDLVKYHILTGAQYGSQSIGKYITYDVLEKYDFSKKLRDIDNLLRNSQLFNNFIRQYFQNNPFKASTFDLSQIGGSAGEVIIVPTNNNPLRNKDNEPVAYFSVYDSVSRTPILYERSNISPSNIEYTKIPVLGNKFIKKYDYLDNNSGAYSAPSKEVLPKTTDTTSNASVDLTTTEYIDSRYGSNSIAEILDNIKNKSSNPYFRKTSSDLLNSNGLNGVNFEYSTERIANGWYDSSNNTIYINPDAIKSTGKDILDKFEEVFLHELLHAGTVNSIDNYINLPDNQKKAVKKIQRLFTEYRNNYRDQDELFDYININNKRLDGVKLTPEEDSFLRNNKSKLYHLTNVKEFIAAGLTNPDVTTELKNKNLFTRLLDFIADLLGINSNDLEFLYQSTIELIVPNEDISKYHNSNAKSKNSLNKILNSKIGDTITLFLNGLPTDYTKTSENKFEGYEITPEQETEIINSAEIAESSIEDLIKKYGEKVVYLESDLINKYLDDMSNNTSEDLFTPNDDYNRLEFVKQRDEFLRAHKTFIGKRITDNTLQKFIQSQQSKDKYNRLKISSWNGELRISRVDPIYEDIAEGKSEKESPKDRAINSLIDRLQESLKRFKRRRTQLGDEVDATLDTKIVRLEERLKSLQAEKSISNYMRVAEDKVNEISSNLDSYGDLDTINDARSYISALTGINKTLEFTEEFSEWNDRLDKISAKADKLNVKLLKKASEIITEIVKNKTTINYNVSNALNKGLKDVGRLESLFQDYSQSSSEDVQIIGTLIDRFKFDANQEHNEFLEEFLPIIEEYRSKYKNDYSQFLQLDDKGKPTGFLINKYKDSFYKESKGKPEYRYKNIELTKANEDRYQKELRFAYDNLSPEDYLAWEANNNPHTYMEAWKLGKKSKQTGARRFLEITPKEEWIDPQYTKLNSLPDSDPAKKLYKFIDPILRRNNKRYGQQANYIPELQKSVSDQLLEGKAKDAVDGLTEDLRNTFTDDSKVKERDVDILTGEERLYIPVSMFGDNLDFSQKSTDLAAITERVVFQEITLNYKYQAEPILNAYYSILKESNQFLKYDENGVPITIDKPATKLLEHSQFIIQDYLYNRNRADNNLERKIGKGIDKAIDLTRILGMGWNPFSAIGNLMQGLTSNFTYASGSNYFNKKEYTKATGIMMHTIAGNSDTSKKVSKMFQKFDTFVKSNELNYGKSRELASATQSKFKELIEPYNMQQKGEYFIQGQTMVSILLNTKVDTPEGKISLFEGYDSNGKWQSKYGDDPMADPDKLFKMTMRIRKAIIDVHGNYARPIMVKKDWYGRSAMIFRTWLPQLLSTRFGAEQTDILLDVTTKGRYLSYGSMFKDSEGKLDLGALGENLKYLIGLSGNTTLSELDKSNMRKNIAELAMIVAITLATMALKAGLDDLDDEEKLYTTYILNNLSRANGDLTFFMLPSSFQQITQDPIPLMRTFQNTIDILPASWNYIIGEDEYKSGVRKGRSKLGKEITDLVPFVTQIDKNWTYMNQVFDN